MLPACAPAASWAQSDAHLVSSSSSILWMAPVSYLVLSLDTRRCSSDLPPLLLLQLLLDQVQVMLGVGETPHGRAAGLRGPDGPVRGPTARRT